MWVCASFTKTQSAGDITHVRVAEILRHIASFCSLVRINNEADYYETRDREKMLNAFGECSKLINKRAPEPRMGRTPPLLAPHRL
jgi:hypothetical protein